LEGADRRPARLPDASGAEERGAGEDGSDSSPAAAAPDCVEAGLNKSRSTVVQALTTGTAFATCDAPNFLRNGEDMTRSKPLAAVVAALILPAAAMAESIEGTVDFGGKAPTPGKLHREADPYCAKKTMTDP